MMNLLLPCAIFTMALLPARSSAQATAFGHLDANQVKARFNSWGLIGENTATSEPDLEVPVGGGVHPLFSAGPWFVGTAIGGQLHAAAIRYEDAADGDYWPGPLTTDGTASITTTVSADYDHVWCINKADVVLQQEYFACLSTPGCDVSLSFPGYEIPPDFFEWPAHGPAGYDTYLAPFNDFDQDGLYNPTNGDSPCIPGDKACYMVFNDKKLHTLTGTQPLGIQVQLMAFAYDGVDPAIDHTVFLYYKVQNKSTATYNNAYVGLFSDFDLGNPTDDYVGSDPARNLVYGYNGDDTDEAGSFSPGYGVQPPAFGAVLLQGPRADADGLDAAADPLLPDFNGFYESDGVIDNEHLGLSYASYMLNSAGPMGDASLGVDHLNRMRAIWNDGSPQTYDGNGYGGSVNARYMFPDDADPDGLGTGGVPQAPWTESSGATVPDDRRALASMGPFTWEPGAIHNVMFAYTYARAWSGGAFASVAALQDRVDSVRAFADGFGFEELNAEDLWCGSDVGTAIGPDPTLLTDLLIYPSPAHGTVQVAVPASLLGSSVIVRDALGRMVNTTVARTTTYLDLSHLASGVYICEVGKGSVRLTGRIVKE